MQRDHSSFTVISLDYTDMTLYHSFRHTFTRSSAIQTFINAHICTRTHSRPYKYSLNKKHKHIQELTYEKHERKCNKISRHTGKQKQHYIKNNNNQKHEDNKDQKGTEYDTDTVRDSSEKQTISNQILQNIKFSYFQSFLC